MDAPSEMNLGFENESTDATYIEYLNLSQVTEEQRIFDAINLAEPNANNHIYRSVREGRKALNDALDAMREGQWALAIDHFNHAQPKFEDVELFRGELTVIREQKSMAYFEMARDIYDLRLKGGDLDQAEKLLQKAYEIDPENAKAKKLQSDIEKFRKRSQE